MRINEYQEAAAKTAIEPSEAGAGALLALLGLSGEVGELLTEYKKLLRDGPSHTRFKERLIEELGDIMWYLAYAATVYGISLEDIAAQNLEKTLARWGHRTRFDVALKTAPHMFDEKYPPHERIPRHFIAHFCTVPDGSKTKTRVFVNGTQLGEDMTDNSYEPDGYRFHDVFHLACAAVLGWSPVTRRNLKLGKRGKSIKRKSNPKTDEVEDGGRAIVTEEGISALVFAYAIDHASFQGVGAIDHDLLESIRVLASKFEVAACTTGEWEAAILMGYRVWNEVASNQGGRVEVNLDNRTIKYLGPI